MLSADVSGAVVERVLEGVQDLAVVIDAESIIRDTDLSSCEISPVEIVNATKMLAAYAMGMDPDGRERVVVVIKGTFDLPLAGEDPELSAQQIAPVMADVFTGEPGFSATLYESEFAPFKPRCDVLLNGSAHSPNGQPVESIQVSLRVGAMLKSFRVVGDRTWKSGFRRSTPFLKMPITYDRAFGGTDEDDENPENNLAYMKNPIGVGFYPVTRGEALDCKPLPNTEELNKKVTNVKGDYLPMSFGPIGRNFESRIPLGGTYDQLWQDNVFPFLPTDFDPLYYQSAPVDQQIDYPIGGEVVELINLAPQQRIVFRLPLTTVPVEFTDESFNRSGLTAPLDTILLEPNDERLTLTWRASAPLARGMLSMKSCVVGRMSRGWYRARDLGKVYYPSLAQGVAAKAEDFQ